MGKVALYARFVVLSIAAMTAACGDDGGKMLSGELDTAIDDGPAALANATSATFTFHAVASGGADASTATFACSIDGGSPGACTSPFTATVTEGDHTFFVSAVDAKGNPDNTPASKMWKVDATPPDTQLTMQPAAIDNTPTPTIAFAGTDNNTGALTFECQTDTGTFAACTSPTTLASLADGSHTFAARAIDAAGNLDPTPASVTWVVDTTSPDTMITSGPADASVSNATPSFTFTSSTTGATFQCKVDGGTFAACTSPFTASPALVDGMHTFTVRAKDGNGVVDPTPPSRTWMVDAIAPDVAIVSTPPNPSNLPMPIFTFGSSDASATFECAIGAAAFAACSNPYTVPSIADGSNTLKVRAVDAVGNHTATPATYTWVTDTVAPGLTITSQPPATSNNPKPQVTFSYTGSPTTITCQIDTGAAIACASPFTAPAQAEGSHTITVTVTDAAGNATSKTAGPFTIDLTPPVVTITSGPPNPTKLKTPAFTFTAPGAAQTLCDVDGGGFAACTSPFTTTTLTDGSHTVTVKGIDAVGNAATASQTFVVDTIAPALTITGSPANPTNQATATFTFTVTSGPATTTCQVDGGAAGACTSPFTTGALTEASHTVTIVATDTAGNSSTAAKTFTVDLTAPTVMITSSPPSPTNAKTGTVMFTVTGGATSTQCQLDGGAFAACSSPYTTPTLTDGTHQVVIKVQDAAGNVATATATWVVDTGAPVVTITGGPSGTIGTNSGSFTFTVTGTPTSITCQLDAGAFVACTSPYNVSGLADGPHTVTVKATDAASNSGTDFRSFTVDTTPPTVTITAQPAANTNVNPPSVSFTVTGGATSTQCSLDGGAFADCTSPFSPGALADGSHTITIRATDFVGNAQSKSATFNLDTVAPTVMITGAPGALTNQTKPPITFTTGGSPSAITCQIDAGAFVACTSPFTPSVALGDGSHTITVKVVDLAGNSSTDSVTFTVDATPPTVTITAAPPANWSSTSAMITFTTAGSPTAIDCSLDGGAFAPCTTMTTFSVAGLTEASHTMTVRVTDAATNTGTASATFIVDVTPPTVTITTTFANPTNNNKPPISFTTGGSPTSIQCQIDTGLFAACTSPFTPGAALTEGLHTITVKVTDAAGNSGTDSVTFTVDTIPPTVTINTGPTNPTNNPIATITFTTGGSPTLVECSLDGAAFASCTTPYTTGTLTEASHTIIVKVTDSAGNHSQAQTTFVVDTTAPTLVFNQVPPDPTNVANQSIKFTATGNTTLQCSLDGAAFATCTSPFATGAIADGPHTFSAKAGDAAGNSTTITTTWTLDTAAPSFMITGQPPANTNATNPSTSFTTGSDTTVTDCQINSGAFNACTSAFAPALAEGTNYTITVRQKDAAGNVATHTTTAFNVDRTNPVITLSTIASPSNNTTPALTIGTDQAGDVLMCAVDAGALAPCTSPFTPSPALLEGSHTITVLATDLATNSATKTTPSFVVDTTPPAVSITAQPSTPTTDNTPSVSFTADVGATTTCQINSGAFNACTSPFTSAALGDGSYTITVKATDTAGNSATDATTPFVIDTTAPGLVAGGSANGYPVHSPSWTFSSLDPTATFKCKTSAVGTFATCVSPWTPTTLPVGPQTITIVASDPAGNSSPGRLFQIDNDPLVMCLDGTTDWGETTMSGVLDTMSASTVEFWFRGGLDRDETMARFSTPQNGPEAVDFKYVAGGKLRVLFTPLTAAASQRTWTPPATYDVTAWHHYAFVFNGTTQKLYIDGTAVATATQDSGAQTTTFSTIFGADTGGVIMNVDIGANTGDTTTFAQGGFLDMRISNAEIYVAAFSPPFPLTTPPASTALLQYPFDEGAGTQSFEDHSSTTNIIGWLHPHWSSTACFQ